MVLRTSGPPTPKAYEMARSTRSGFTLVEILVVITIIAALMALAVPVYQNAQDKANSTSCKNNLRQMAMTLGIFKEDRNKGRWPKERGIQFLLVLAKYDMIAPKDMKMFLCPGTEDDNVDPDNPEKKPGSLYADWDNLDPTSISYAGRDNREFPINKNRQNEEVIASDDNDTRANHRTTTNYVYADSSPASFDIIDAEERGYDLEGLDYIQIGPESPFEEFQKLLVDL